MSRDVCELWEVDLQGPVRKLGVYPRSLPLVQGQKLQTRDGAWWTVGIVSWQVVGWIDLWADQHSDPVIRITTDEGSLVQTIALWPLTGMEDGEDPRFRPW